MSEINAYVNYMKIEDDELRELLLRGLIVLDSTWLEEHYKKE